jgi:homoserine kinase
VSNLGSGFDVIGVAIDRPGDVVVASRQERSGLSFSLDSLSKEVPGVGGKNVAEHVASLMLQEFKPPFGIKLTLQKRMPVGSGLGSSAASSVASVVAVNALLPKPLNKRDLLRFVVEGERMASGSPHADNVAPSLLGGVCLIRSYDPLDVEAIPIRNRIVWVVVHPHFVVRTEEARGVLPSTVSLKSAIRQWGNFGGLVAGLMKGDAGLVGKCVEDVIVEPARSHLVPGFYEVKQSAIKAGATGCGLSGSGPSLFAVAVSSKAARTIASAMVKTFSRVAGVKCDVFISRTNMSGASVLSKSSR